MRWSSDDAEALKPKDNLQSSSSSSTSQPLDNYTISHQAQNQSQMEELSQEIENDEDARQAIVANLLQILEQPINLLRQGKINDDQMQAESKLIPGSSLGKHLRHVHDHYRILLDNFESQSSSTTSSSSSSTLNKPIDLDYDKRMRLLPLETNTKIAMQEFEKAQKRVSTLFRNIQLNQKINLNATTPAQIKFKSTLGREMWFVCLHSIHHYALARVILVHELGIKIDDSFGVAPSTMVMRLWRQASQDSSLPLSSQSPSSKL